MAFKVAIVIEGELEEIRVFSTERDRDTWIEGAYFGADQYGGDGFCCYTKEEIEESLARDPEYKAEAFKRALTQLE